MFTCCWRTVSPCWTARRVASCSSASGCPSAPYTRMLFSSRNACIGCPGCQDALHTVAAARLASTSRASCPNQGHTTGQFIQDALQQGAPGLCLDTHSLFDQQAAGLCSIVPDDNGTSIGVPCLAFLTHRRCWEAQRRSRNHVLVRLAALILYAHGVFSNRLARKGLP